MRSWAGGLRSRKSAALRASASVKCWCFSGYLTGKLERSLRSAVSEVSLERRRFRHAKADMRASAPVLHESLKADGGYRPVTRSSELLSTP